MAEGGTFDAVVIGSGPNGLAAAITLAEAKRAVLVVERNAVIGGGARTAELTQPGFYHDICSTVHPLAVGSRFFNTRPLEEHGLRWVHPTTPLAHPLDDGDLVCMERSQQATSGQFTAGDARHYYRMIGRFSDRWNELSDEILQPLHIPKHPVLLAQFGCHAARSAASAVRKFDSSQARALFAGLAAHSVLPLEQAPSAAIGLVLAAAGHAVGWPFPAGGAQQISEALAAYFRSLGGRIETERPIHSMKDLPEARAYLFDTSPGQLATIAGDTLPEGYRERLQRFQHGPGIFKIDWALSQPIPWRNARCATAGTVHVGGSFEEIADAERACWQDQHTDRPFVLLAQPTLFDPSRAPAGQHIAWGYCHVPHRSTVDMTNAIEAQIERFAPGFRDCIVARHMMNCGDMEAHNPNLVGGDISGGSTTCRQLIARPVLRWRPYATPNPKLFLCSSSTPPGGGVHGLCGMHAAETALRSTLA